MFIYELFEQIHILLCLEFCTPGLSDCKQGSTKAVARWTSTNIFSGPLSLIVQSAFTYLNLSSRVRALLFLQLYSDCTALKILFWAEKKYRIYSPSWTCLPVCAHLHTHTQANWSVEGSSISSGLWSTDLDKSLEAIAWAQGKSS